MRTYSVPAILALLCFTVIAFLSSCSDLVTILISVDGITADITALQVDFVLNGRPALAKQFVTNNIGQFAVRIPLDESIHGDLSIKVSGLSSDLCKNSSGQTSIRIDSNYALAKADVKLTLLPTKICTLQVNINGLGTVHSVPSGINCNTQCDYDFPYGSAITLTAEADVKSYPNRWSGMCSGFATKPCSIVLNGPAKVDISLSKRVCSSSGWCWQNPLPQGQDLNGVWGSSTGDMWAVGRNGVTLHFDGLSWVPVKNGIGKNLNAVWGSSPNDVWLVGAAGSILHWDGSQLVASNANTSSELTSIWGSSQNSIWVVGSNGTINNWAGASWLNRGVSPSINLNGVFGLDENHVWAVGSNGNILNYNGSQWTSINSSVSQTLNAVWASGSNDVWAVGDSGTILRWDGVTWQNKSVSTGNLYAVWGSGTNDVWAVGVGGTTLHWNGQVWSPIASSVSTDIRGIWGTDARTFLTVGAAGTMTAWDGTSWGQLVDSLPAPDLLGIWGSSPTDIWMTGQRGTILRYNGKNLSRFTDPNIDTTMTILDVWGSSPNSIWMSGWFGSLYFFDGASVSRKVTSGDAFDPKTTESLTSLAGATAGGNSYLWAVGLTGTIRRQISGSWTTYTAGNPSSSQNLYKVYSFVVGSTVHAWIVGDMGALFRFDGNLTWPRVTSNRTESLVGLWGHPSDFGKVWIVGSAGLIMQSSGGVPSIIPSGTTNSLNGVWGSGPNDVWIVGQMGTIIHWDGLRLVASDSGTTNSLIKVWGSSATDIWAVGPAGTILRYQPQ